MSFPSGCFIFLFGCFVLFLVPSLDLDFFLLLTLSYVLTVSPIPRLSWVLRLSRVLTLSCSSALSGSHAPAGSHAAVGSDGLLHSHGLLKSHAQTGHAAGSRCQGGPLSSCYRLSSVLLLSLSPSSLTNTARVSQFPRATSSCLCSCARAQQSAVVKTSGAGVASVVVMWLAQCKLL